MQKLYYDNMTVRYAKENGISPEQFIKKYYSFKAEIEELDNKIKSTGDAEKFRNFNKQLEDINLGIEKNNDEFEKLKNDVVKLENQISNLTNEIESSVKEMFNEEIKVVA